MGQRFCEELVIHICFDMRVFDGAASDHACLEYPMPKNAKFKTLVRSRMERTGETYTQARDALLLEKTAQPPVEAAATAPTTLDRIRAVLEQYPDLAYRGFRTGGLLNKDVREKGLSDAVAAEEAEFASNRACLLTDYATKEVELCLDYLANLRANKHPTVSSYGLKHAAERWSRRDGGSRGGGSGIYVANGSLIVAAILKGFPITHAPRLPLRLGNINCEFAVSVADMRATERRIEGMRDMKRRIEGMRDMKRRIEGA